MDAASMNQFVYNLHYKVEAMEAWAATVNDAVTDHAVHIDNAKGKSINAFRACATNESDTRKVMGMVQANDDALKLKLSEIVAQIEATVVQSKTDMQQLTGTIDTKIRELQTAQAQQGVAAPPGATDAAGMSLDTSALEPLRAEIASVRGLLMQHDTNPAHLLQPQALMQRLTAIEGAVTSLQQVSQAAASAPDAPPGMGRAGAGSFGANFGGNLSGRFDAAAGGSNNDDGGSMPQPHDNGSMPRGTRGPFNMASGDAPSDKLRLDSKLARIDKHLYLDNAPETWHKNVRTYLVGQHIDMKPFLSWIEGRGHSPITAADLESDLGLMMTLDPMHISRELWSWLNLSLEKSASAQQTFHNIEELNGAEVYRQLVVPLGVTKASVTRRNFLRDKVQQPKQAKSMTSLMDVLGDWTANKLAFVKAGGTPHGDEDERAQLYKILPSNISQDMLSHAHDQPTAVKLIEWMREKELFLREHSSKHGESHLVADAEARSHEPLPPLLHTQYGTEWLDDYNEITEEEAAEMPDSEILAFVRRGGKIGKGKGKSRKGKGKGKGGSVGKGYGAGAPPRGKGDIVCVNCGGKGHDRWSCTKAVVALNDRLCFKCGKPGHISRDCPNGSAAMLDGGDSAQAKVWNLDDAHAKVCCSDATCGATRQRGRPFQKILDSEGFELVTGGFQPPPRRIGDIPVTRAKRSQRATRAERFALCCVAFDGEGVADVRSPVNATPVAPVTGDECDWIDPRAAVQRSG